MTDWAASYRAEVDRRVEAERERDAARAQVDKLLDEDLKARVLVQQEEKLIKAERERDAAQKRLGEVTALKEGAMNDLHTLFLERDKFKAEIVGLQDWIKTMREERDQMIMVIQEVSQVIPRLYETQFSHDLAMRVQSVLAQHRLKL